MMNRIFSRTAYFIFTLIFCLGMLAGCTVRKNQQNEQNQTKEKVIKIGFSMDSIRRRFEKDLDALTQRAAELGVDLQVLSANNNDEVQIAQAKSLVDSGVDVLMVLPHNVDTAAEIVNYAHEKGIPVLSYDRLIRNADVDAYVTFDPKKISQQQVEYLTKIAPTGNYVYIGGDAFDINAVFLRNEARDALKPYIDSGKIKLVYDELTPEWSPTIAQQNMEKLLHAYDNNIAAVISANDNMAGGVISALTTHQLAGKIPVTGQDADLLALQRIVQGMQTMTVYKPAKKIADTALNVAIDLAKKEKFESNAAIYNGKIDVPSVLLEPIAVDESNIIDTVIKDNYQSYEKVYENILEDETLKGERVGQNL